jgi:hypothetical protein
MVNSLNSYLLGQDWTPTGFGVFTLDFDENNLICTKRSGPDGDLGTGDDICEAFLYPSCVTRSVQRPTAILRPAVIP